MSDKIRSALNNAVKVLVGGLLLVLLGGVGDVANWVNGGAAPDLGTYYKAGLVLLLAFASSLASLGIDWLKGFSWFPGVAPTYVKPPEK